MEHQTGLEGPDGTEEASLVAGEPEPEPQGVAESEPERVAESEPEQAQELVSTTGEPRVDAALRLLDRLPGLAVSDHPEVFEHVHAQLSDVLGELDSGSAGPAGD